MLGIIVSVSASSSVMVMRFIGICPVDVSGMMHHVSVVGGGNLAVTSVDFARICQSGVELECRICLSHCSPVF